MALFLLYWPTEGKSMTRNHQGTTYRPRLIGERKPLRPVQVAAVRRPVKVTKPIVLGGETLPARRIG